MRSESSRSLLALVLLPLVLACGAADEPATEATGEPTPAAAPADAGTGSPQQPSASAPAAAPGDTTSAPATVPAAAPAAAAAAVLASQETNWSGIVAEVTEFRRKGNTLTAKLRFRNQGSDANEADLYYSGAYLMDAAAGKKYEVLKDEKGAYIAALRTGWNDRWYQTVEPGQSAAIWMKFPAPPPEVTAVTLQVPGVPPFDDLSIQDS